MQIAGGHPDPRISLMPRLRQVLRGVEIMKGRQGSTKRPRLPITPTILKRIKGVGFLSKEDRGRGLADQKMLWAASLTAFFGFCRSGEITLPQDGGYDPGIHLSYRDVAVDNPGQPRIISLLLRRSKTDQVGKGVKVILGRTSHDLCPVAAVLDYLGSRGSDAWPLFRWSDGRLLTRTHFVEEVRIAYLPAKNFAGHSFCIGAATTAVAAGVEDSTIQALGRWNSSAFLRYIRASPKTLEGVSRVLASRNI